MSAIVALIFDLGQCSPNILAGGLHRKSDKLAKKKIKYVSKRQNMNKFYFDFVAPMHSKKHFLNTAKEGTGWEGGKIKHKSMTGKRWPR